MLNMKGANLDGALSQCQMRDMILVEPDDDDLHNGLVALLKSYYPDDSGMFVCMFYHYVDLNF